MSLRMDRRQFLKAAALTGGVVGAGALVPYGADRLTWAASETCRLGGNSPFIAAEESQLGTTVSAHRIFKRWDEEIFSSDVVASADKGRRLVISVFPSNRDRSSAKRWHDIASGKYDGDIKRMASELKGFAATHSRKVVFCFNHEPENDRDESVGTFHMGTEADFRAAFNHFFAVLGAQGVKNILRTLILMGSSYNSGAANAYWPGGSRVDRLGVDCYNWFGTVQQPQGQWRSFRQCVQGAYNFAAAKARRLYVCETATLEDPNDPSRKATWISEMGATLKSMPRIKAVMYFEGAKNGWSVSSPPQGSPAALAAFKALIADPYFV